MKLKCPECAHEFAENVSLFELAKCCPACGFCFNVGGQIKTDVWERLHGFSRLEIAPDERDKTATPSGPGLFRQSPISRDFGDYEIVEEIARGGVGIIYRARQKSLNRIVAIKVLLAGEAASEEQVSRFYQEAKAAARLRHPNIVSIYEVGRIEGVHYFSMELVEGISLNHLIARGQLNYRRIVSIITQVAEAVDYAHQKSIIHRDLKPANIILDNQNIVKVTDFGLARDVSGKETNITRDGQVMGTPAYMPPEQAAGHSNEIDERSDVYSIGAVLYEMLTGHSPFVAETPLGVIMKVLHDDPPLPRKHDQSIPRDLETICLKAMMKSKFNRYRTAKAFAEDLRRFSSGEPILAKPQAWWRRSLNRLWHYRHTAAMLALLALLMSFFLGQQSFDLPWLARPSENARQVIVDYEMRRILGEKNWMPLFPEIAPRDYLLFMEAPFADGGDWTESDAGWGKGSELYFRQPACSDIRMDFAVVRKVAVPDALRIFFCEAPDKRNDAGYSVTVANGRISIGKNGLEVVRAAGPRFDGQKSASLIVKREKNGIYVYDHGIEEPLAVYVDKAPLDANRLRTIVLSQEKMAFAVKRFSLQRIFETDPKSAESALSQGNYVRAVEAYSDLLTSGRSTALTTGEVLERLAICYENLAIRAATVANDFDALRESLAGNLPEAATIDTIDDVLHRLAQLENGAVSEREVPDEADTDERAAERDRDAEYRRTIRIYHEILALIEQSDRNRRAVDRLLNVAAKIHSLADGSRAGNVHLAAAAEMEKSSRLYDDPDAAQRIGVIFNEYLSAAMSARKYDNDARGKKLSALIEALAQIGRGLGERQKTLLAINAGLLRIPGEARKMAVDFFNASQEHFDMIIGTEGTAANVELAAKLGRMRVGLNMAMLTGIGKRPDPYALETAVDLLRKQYHSSDEFFDFFVYLASLDFEKYSLDGPKILEVARNFTVRIKSEEKRALVHAALSRAYFRLAANALGEDRINFLDRARKLDGKHIAAHIALAETYFELAGKCVGQAARNENFERAIRCYENARENDPDALDALRRIAEIRLVMANLASGGYNVSRHNPEIEKALDAYAKYFRRAPWDGETCLTLGKVCINMGYYSEAMQYMHDFLNTKPASGADLARLPSMNMVHRAEAARLYRKAKRLYAAKVRRDLIF